MGQKVHPLGSRLRITQDHRSSWFANQKTYPLIIEEDHKIRDYIKREFSTAGISKIEIQRIERELREDIDIRRREEIGKLQAKINEAIEEMAKTDKYDLILYQGVAYASKEIDITDKLIKVLGKTK